MTDPCFMAIVCYLEQQNFFMFLSIRLTKTFRQFLGSFFNLPIIEQLDYFESFLSTLIDAQQQPKTE